MNITASSTHHVSITPPTPTFKATLKSPTASLDSEISSKDQLVSTLRNDASLLVFLCDEFFPQAHVGTAALFKDVPVALQDAQSTSKTLTESVKKFVFFDAKIHFRPI